MNATRRTRVPPRHCPGYALAFTCFATFYESCNRQNYTRRLPRVGAVPFITDRGAGGGGQPHGVLGRRSALATLNTAFTCAPPPPPYRPPCLPAAWSLFHSPYYPHPLPYTLPHHHHHHTLPLLRTPALWMPATAYPPTTTLTRRYADDTDTTLVICCRSGSLWRATETVFGAASMPTG